MEIVEAVLLMAYHAVYIYTIFCHVSAAGVNLSICGCQILAFNTVNINTIIHE